MLTCKIGNSIINTIEHDNEEIRKWSDKGILKCPVCEGKMIYKNGQIRIQHFAHEKEECEFTYYENETEEHMQGKILLYNWLKTQNDITNLKLEAWIPETKQRPDLYFEINNKKYVIEYQCTPISSEYLERHKLYELSGITDIWILGFNNYNIKNIELKNQYIYKALEIEKILMFNNDFNLCYLNTVNKSLHKINPYSIKALINRKTMFDINFSIIQLEKNNIHNIIKSENYNVGKNKIIKWVESQDILENIKINEVFFKELTPLVYFEVNKEKYAIEYITRYICKDEFKELKDKYTTNKINLILILDSIIYGLYLTKDICENNNMFEASFYNILNNNISILKFDKKVKYINTNYTCEVDKYNIYTSNIDDIFMSGSNIENKESVSFKLNKSIENIKTKNKTEKDYIYKNQNDIFSYEKSRHIKELKEIDDKERHNKKMLYVFSEIKDILNEKITLIDGNKKISKNIRFKFLKDFFIENENYIVDIFAKEIRFLKHKNIKEIFVMIPKNRINILTTMDYIYDKMKNYYGFKNINISNKDIEEE